jgi:3-methyl-2-oxobutanoate hydroxymethyltransferase
MTDGKPTAGNDLTGTEARRKLTVPEIRSRKHGDPLVMVTGVDFQLARFAEAAGIDLLLVGDSLGMAFQGHDSTAPVTLDDIVYHCRAVRRGAPHTHLVADLPFLAGAIDDGETIRNAGRLIQEGGADGVKLEGGATAAGRIRAMTDAGIPVFGHVGLLPQRVGQLGGFRMQGGDAAAARAILADAAAVAAAGAYALVVEAVPAELAAAITARVPVPTVGIGAGAACDGQVLVSADLLGLEDRFKPRFVKRYADLAGTVRQAYRAYAADVRARAFPGPEHAYKAKHSLDLDRHLDLDLGPSEDLDPGRSGDLGLGQGGTLLPGRSGDGEAPEQAR